MKYLHLILIGLLCLAVIPINGSTISGFELYQTQLARQSVTLYGQTFTSDIISVEILFNFQSPTSYANGVKFYVSITFNGGIVGVPSQTFTLATYIADTTQAIVIPIIQVYYNTEGASSESPVSIGSNCTATIDIYSLTESGSSGEKIETLNSNFALQSDDIVKSLSKNKIVLYGVIGGGIVLTLGGGFLLYRYMKKSKAKHTGVLPSSDLLPYTFR